MAEQTPKAAPGGWREAIEAAAQLVQRRSGVSTTIPALVQAIRALASPLPEDKGRADIAAEVPEGDGGYSDEDYHRLHKAHCLTQARREAAETALAASRAEVEQGLNAVRFLETKCREYTDELAASRAEAQSLREWRTQMKARGCSDCLEKEDAEAELAVVEAELTASRARADALAGALEPFARFWDALQHLGGTTPKTGAVYNVASHIGGERTLTVEDFKAAAALAGSKGGEG